MPCIIDLAKRGCGNRGSWHSDPGGVYSRSSVFKTMTTCQREQEATHGAQRRSRRLRKKGLWVVAFLSALLVQGGIEVTAFIPHHKLPSFAVDVPPRHELRRRRDRGEMRLS